MSQQLNQVLNEAKYLGINIIAGSGAPTGISAIKGTLYVNTTASTTTTRLYINTDGGTTWTNFTTAA